MADDLGIKILVVDDMMVMRKVIKRMLNTLGYTNVGDGTDGANGWEAIQEAIKAGDPYDLILSDWNMPNMTGIELLKKVRATSGLEKLPFILITAEPKADHIKAATEAGVNYYMPKPFTEPELQEKIKSLFGPKWKRLKT